LSRMFSPWLRQGGASSPAEVGAVFRIAAQCFRLERRWRFSCQPLPTAHLLTYSLTKLPVLNCLHRPEEHQHVEQQTVADPEQQPGFDPDEQRQRPPPADAARHREADDAGEQIAERVDYRVARVAERCGRFAIAVDDELGVLDDFPE